MPRSKRLAFVTYPKVSTASGYNLKSCLRIEFICVAYLRLPLTLPLNLGLMTGMTQSN